MLRARRSLAALACGALAVGALAAGCGDDDDSDAGASTAGTVAASTDPIVIGLANAQTGAFSFFDGAVSNGIQLAVDDLNAAGGIAGRKIEIVKSDAKSDPNVSAAAAIDVLDQGADIVVTMCDYDLGAPAGREAVQAGKLALSCAGSPLFGTKGVGPYAFSVNEGTPTSGAIGGDFALGEGWKTAYLLEDTSGEFQKTWCDWFENAFTAGGGEIVGTDTFASADTTVATQVSRLRSEGGDADVIAICGYPPSGATAVKQIREAGIDTPIVGTSGFDGPGWLEAVPNVSDVYAVASASIFGDDPSAEVNDAVAAYTDAFGAPGSAYGLFGTTMVDAIELAATETGGDVSGEALTGAMEGFTDAPLILGPTTYTASCHIALGRPMQIVQFQDGKGSWLKTVSPAEVPQIPECEE